VSRPVCQVWRCTEPAITVAPGTIVTGSSVDVRVCREHADLIIRALEAQALKMHLSIARKRT
jgi:hypothetical protein